MNEKYFWVSPDVTILIMDNPGGHATDNATTNQHTTNINDTYNITIIYQILQSPFTIVLDLGIWVSLHSVVEKIVS